MKAYRKPKSEKNLKEKLEIYNYKKEERAGNISILNMFNIMNR